MLAQTNIKVHAYRRSSNVHENMYYEQIIHRNQDLFILQKNRHGLFGVVLTSNFSINTPCPSPVFMSCAMSFTHTHNTKITFSVWSVLSQQIHEKQKKWPILKIFPTRRWLPPCFPYFPTPHSTASFQWRNPFLAHCRLCGHSLSESSSTLSLPGGTE